MAQGHETSEMQKEPAMGRRSADRSKENLAGDSSRSLRIFGSVLLGLLAVITLLVYAQKFVQLDNWSYWFFRDVVHLADTCEASAVQLPEDKLDRSMLIRERHVPLRVPHDTNALRNLAGGVPTANATLAGHFQCSISSDELRNHKGGVAYLHLGWIFGSEAVVAINGADRVKFVGSDKPVIALNKDDFATGTLIVDVWVLGKTSGSFGLSGRQPPTIALDSVTNARIMGLETAVSQMRRLYNLFPVIFLGLICLLAWVYGFRSRLIAATAYFSALSSVQYALYMFAEVFPWGLPVTYAMASVFHPAAMFSLFLFGLVLFGWRIKWLPYLIISQLTVLSGASAVVMAKQDGLFAYKFVIPSWNLVNSILLMAMASAIIMRQHYRQNSAKNAAFKENRKRPREALLGAATGKNAITFAIFIFVTGIIGLIDIMLDQFRVALVLTKYIDVFLPLFIGAITLNALAAVDRKYRAERLFRFQIEHDLAIARDIQDSLAPPPEKLFSGDRRVECLQVKHAKVAGDWMAVRELPDGRLVAIVADATGKGVQAALVVHAVQSLWADTLGESDFQPEPWIHRVNRVLLRMGEKKKHSMTLGVLVLEGQQFSYWSAGHVPLFVVSNTNEEKPEIKSFPAVGNVLGLKEELTLKRTDGSLTKGEKYGILLGTDGTFEKGSRTSRREIAELWRELRSESGEALKKLTTDDDRTLVFIDIGQATQSTSSVA